MIIKRNEMECIYMLLKTLWTIAQGLASNTYQYAGLYDGNVDTVV